MFTSEVALSVGAMQDLTIEGTRVLKFDGKTVREDEDEDEVEGRRGTGQ